MKKEIKNLFPNWVNDDRYYDLILSDDLDSLFSCEILKEVKGWQINYFNDSFKALGITEFANSEKPIGVDLSLCEGKTFDNHVVMMNEYDDYNSESANFNIIDKISRENYFDKYCGSTLLMIWSLYDIPLPETDEGKMILLCIDSTFKGFYSPWPKPRKANERYLVDYMGFPELHNLLHRYKQSDFLSVMRKYNLNKKIYLKDGYLQTDIKLDELREIFNFSFFLPKNRFYLREEYKTNIMRLPKNDYRQVKCDISENMYSIALTNRDFMSYSEKFNN